MCRLVDAIERVGAAADNLTRACAREGALVDSTVVPDDASIARSLHRAFRSASLTPTDMLSTLRRLK
jgi:hypothetical protein